jgi:hypothetical protein
VQSKGFKSMNDVLTSAYNAEKLLGAGPDKIIKLPNAAEANSEEAWGQIYDKLGRPKAPTEYGLKGPDGNPTPLTEAIAPVLHKMGLTAKQAGELNQWWNEYAGKAGETQKAEHDAKVAEATGQLKTDWGAAYEQNVNIAKTAAKEFGITEEQVAALDSALGTAATLKFLHNIGSKIGEGQFVSGATQGFGSKMAPAQAAAEIKALQQDQNFITRLQQGETEALKRWQQLHEWKANGASITL